MKKNVNLDKLKDEISSRHKEKNQIHGNEGAPKDKFLYGLLSSLKTGQVNESTNLIKTVDVHTAKKLGEKPSLKIDENVPVSKPQPMRDVPAQPVNMSPEREEQLWRDMEAKKKQTLAESIQGYYSQNTHQQYPPQYQQQQNSPMLNEERLVGAVKGTVDKYLSENFGLVVEEAIKSTILEMYAVERIKEVLNENKDLVKKLVYETIREIQEKNKNKKV
jgi:hypothetical protein